MRSLSISTLVTASFFAISVPAQGITVAFVSDAPDVASLRLGDPAIWAFLQQRYTPANVTYRSTRPVGAPALKGSDLIAYDVAVLSSVPSSGNYRNNGFDVAQVPIVNFEEAVADDSSPGEFAVTTGRTKEIEIDHKVIFRTAHPIAAGFPLNTPIQIATGSSELWWSTGTQALGATSVAEDDDTPTNMFVTYIDGGGTQLNLNTAACRRVMFGMTDWTFTYLTPDGQKLLGQSIDWAASGCCASNSNYGTGLAGTNGIPTLTSNAPAVFGTTINLMATNSPGVPTQGVLFAGTSPLALSFFGGTVLTLPLVSVGVIIPAAGLTVPLPVPTLSCGVGNTLYFQVLQLDNASPLGISFTDGLRVKMGM